MMADRYHEGVGRRKTSTARVRIVSGTGAMVVNEKPMVEYFPRTGDMEAIMAPLRAAGLDGKLDVSAKVSGGGVTGQTGAVQHGLARALELNMDPELRAAMRRGGLPDPRCTGEGTQEARPQASAQGADLHQALAAHGHWGPLEHRQGLRISAGEVSLPGRFVF